MSSEYKLSLPSQTIDSAEPRARQLLESAKATLGFVPNMYALMVNGPGLLETYQYGYAQFREASGFTMAEQEVIFLTISRENGCDYVSVRPTHLDEAFYVADGCQRCGNNSSSRLLGCEWIRASTSRR